MEHDHSSHGKPATFYASPEEAMQAPPEDLLYVAAMRVGTGVEAPDFLAVVDANPESETYAQIVHQTPMTTIGDELHHFGWNRCSSACHGPDRSHLIVPGMGSSRIHILNVADDPRRPAVEKVIEPEEIVEATGYTRPHTVHCMPGENIVISMMGDEKGDGAGGFAVLDAKSFELKGRWQNGGETPSMNYDFWYQPRKNVLVSSEFAEPNAYEPGFDLADVQAGRYGQRIHFWNLERRELTQTIDLGPNGLVPLELRWLHDPEAEQGFVGAALSSVMYRFYRDNGAYAAAPIIEVPTVELEGWPIPVPGLITDLVLSMDDRFLYFANWLHGDVRQYDVTDPSDPKLTGQVFLGGVTGQPSEAGRPLSGGPNMLQLSLDGRRLYVTNSLYSSWDNQFYPELRSWLLKLDVGEQGGLSVDPDFFVDFGALPEGPARAHEVRFPGGDSTSEVFQ
jgi:selenium-binding protein 1